MRDRTGKSARIAEKIKKKIGIDIVETKPEVLQAVVTEVKKRIAKMKITTCAGIRGIIISVNAYNF